MLSMSDWPGRIDQLCALPVIPFQVVFHAVNQGQKTNYLDAHLPEHVKSNHICLRNLFIACLWTDSVMVNHEAPRRHLRGRGGKV